MVEDGDYHSHYFPEANDAVAIEHGEEVDE